ncbi:MAG: MAPEG family protein, partial [Gammaproteobacteria bacterium]|nr:MAPEG family protein [Gammaproteobacteria bacterium]
LGDGGNKDILHAMRLQANLVEYAPISLLLLLFLELNLLTRLWLHVFGLIFLVARLLHVWGFGRRSGVSTGRVLGTMLTWLNIIAMAVINAFLLLQTF